MLKLISYTTLHHLQFFINIHDHFNGKISKIKFNFVLMNIILTISTLLKKMFYFYLCSKLHTTQTFNYYFDDSDIL